MVYAANLFSVQFRELANFARLHNRPRTSSSRLTDKVPPAGMGRKLSKHERRTATSVAPDGRPSHRRVLLVGSAGAAALAATFSAVGSRTSSQQWHNSSDFAEQQQQHPRGPSAALRPIAREHNISFGEFRRRRAAMGPRARLATHTFLCSSVVPRPRSPASCPRVGRRLLSHCVPLTHKVSRHVDTGHHRRLD